MDGMPEPDESDSEESSEETALLPKSFFPDEPEVGKVCKVEVVHVYEDEVEVKYSTEDKDENPKPKSMMSKSEDDMDNYAKPM